MRPELPVRIRRRGRLVAGALIMLSVPAMTATAGAASAAAATTVGTGAPVPFHLRDRSIGFDRPVVVSGSLPAIEAGHQLQLQFLPARADRWQALSTTTVRPDGRYRATARLRRSGFVRVLDVSGATVAPAPAAGAASVAAVAAGTGRHVSVSAVLHVQRSSLSALGAQAMLVRGRLVPALRGRVVWLQAAGSHGWRTLTSTKTGAAGRFALRFRAEGSERLRVRFAGDRLNARASAAAGSVTVYGASVASWYSDGGQTACGFHAYYGVANRSLPCGTHVKFLYGGRTVTATVDDRGPFVGGRDWDLNQNTAAALGFGGVDAVWASY